MMHTVFLDPREMCCHVLSNGETIGCAIGQLLWQIYEIPFDRMFCKTSIEELEEKDCNRIKNSSKLFDMFEGLDFEELIFESSDKMMVRLNIDSYRAAASDAFKLIDFGKKAGINFVIASKIKVKANCKATV